MASIQDLHNGKYRISFCVDRMRKSKVIRAKSLKDAEKQAIILEDKLRETGSFEKQTSKEQKNMTFGDLCKSYMEWQTEIRHKPIKSKSQENYQNLIAYQLMPYFKGMKVIHITETDVNKFLRYLKTPDARFNKSKREPYSDRTIKDAFTLLNAMLNHAVTKLHVISVNPCDAVDKPTVDNKEAEYYDNEQLIALFNALDTDTELKLSVIEAKRETGRYKSLTLQKEKLEILFKKVCIYLALYTSSRRGEVLGLHREDIDFESGTVHFCHEVVYTKAKGIELLPHLKGTKEKTVWVTDEILDLLKILISELDTLFELGDGVIPYSSRLFIALNNTKLHNVGGLPFPDYYSEYFKNLLNRYNLPYITFHKLRHSSISYMLYRGVDMRTAAKIAGHSSTDQIKKTYGHVYDTEVMRASRVFNGIKGLEGDTNEQEQKIEDSSSQTNGEAGDNGDTGNSGGYAGTGRGYYQCSVSIY